MGMMDKVKDFIGIADFEDDEEEYETNEIISKAIKKRWLIW